jgi:hypothetical protein
MTTITKKKTTTTKKETTNIKLEPNCFQYEILDLVSKQRSNIKKVEILKEYRNDALVSLFIWNFDDSVISLLPSGEVPYADIKEMTAVGGTLSANLNSKIVGDRSISYNGAEEDMKAGKTSLRNEYTKLYNFVKGGNSSLSSIRRETMFINMLQGLHPREAEILCLVKDKKLTDKYKVTWENVKEAYPDISWGGRS